MKKTRFTEAQIMGILRQMESGVPVSELCRERGSKAEKKMILWINFPPNQRVGLQVARQGWQHGRELDQRDESHG